MNEKNPERVERGKLNWNRGRTFEIKVMNKMKNSNCKLVIHSDGSYGLFDLIGLTFDGRTRLVTCKVNSYLSPKERKDLLDYVENYQKENEIVELWYYKSPRCMTKRIITAEVLAE